MGVKSGKGFFDYSDRDLEDVLRTRDDALIEVFDAVKDLIDQHDLSAACATAVRIDSGGRAMKLPAGKVIITASLNGAFVTKEMNPSVPEQPDEIAQASLECYNAGAAIVHIHARDEEGRPLRHEGEVRRDPGRRERQVHATSSSSSPPAAAPT